MAKGRGALVSVNIVGVLNAIMNANTLNDAWDVLCGAMERYGFDRLMYGRSHFTSGMNLGDESDYMVLSNHDPEYFDYFIRSGVFKRSPFFLWSFFNTGFVSWSTLQELKLPGDALNNSTDILMKNIEYGVTAGYTVSFSNALPGQKSTASICARKGMTQSEADVIWSSNRHELEAMSYSPMFGQVSA